MFRNENVVAGSSAFMKIGLGLAAFVFCMKGIKAGIDAIFYHVPEPFPLSSIMCRGGERNALRFDENDIPFIDPEYAKDEKSPPNLNVKVLGHPLAVKKLKYSEIITTDKDKMIWVYNGMVYNKKSIFYQITPDSTCKTGVFICNTGDDSCNTLYND